MTPVKRMNNQSWLPSIFNDFFETSWMPRTNSTAPAINVMETEKSYKIEVAAPGMCKEDFHIHINKENALVISMEKKCKCTDCGCDGKEGEKPEEKKEEEKEPRYLRREFSYSKFQQTLILPDDVDKEHICAKVNDGVLKIKLPKMKPDAKVDEMRSIEIK